MEYLGLSMEASTGKSDDVIGISKPIMNFHALDKTCVLLLLLEYTLLQLIVRILERFTERKRTITLILLLSTWVPLCDGHHQSDAAVPFQSPVGHGNTVMGITRRDDGYCLPSLRGHYRPECSLPEKICFTQMGWTLSFCVLILLLIFLARIPFFCSPMLQQNTS